MERANGEACDWPILIDAVMRMPRGSKKWVFHSDMTAWMVSRRDGLLCCWVFVI